LYGQFTLDEFNLDSLRRDINWWGNKYGVQAGIKAIDFLGINQLDVQAEFNAVRPYTYAHTDTFPVDVGVSQSSYTNNSQPLAHPLGANFVEGILDVRYRVGNKLTLHPRLIFSRYGVDNVSSPDSTGFNIGSNILLPTRNRAGNRNQRWFQGDKVNVSLFALNAYYEFFPNYFADFNLQYRTSSSVQDEYNLNSLYFGFGVRTNFRELYRDY